MVSGLEIRGRSLDPEAMGERGVDELSIVGKNGYQYQRNIFSWPIFSW